MQEISNGINGALENQEILNALSQFGYTKERIQQGKDLWHTANELIIIQIKEYGDQYGATQNSKAQWEISYSNYMVMLKLIRVAFKGNTGALNTLLATGRRSKSLSGWLRESRVLYKNLLENPDFIARIDLYGITKSKLHYDLKKIDEVAANYQLQLKETAEAQQATLNRDKALDELYNWFSDFRAIARIALYENPQMLEALGFLVRSNKGGNPNFEMLQNK